MARPRKWEGDTQGERHAALMRAKRAEPCEETPPDSPPDTGLRCRHCCRLRAELDASQRARQLDLLRRSVSNPVPIDPEGASHRIAARLCNLLLVRYVPREEWAEWERLHPWLLAPEVARRKEEDETAEAAETRAA